MDYKGIARGNMIELEEMLPYTDGQIVRVVVEPLAQQLPAGSPVSIRMAMHAPPHLAEDDVTELERVIAEARLPVGDVGVFDGAQ